MKGARKWKTRSVEVTGGGEVGGGGEKGGGGGGSE